MTQADKPFITIITSSYNVSDTLERCIQSVMGQTYGDAEHIIIDGASDDGTVEILERYSGQLGFWLSEPDRGIYDAWNKAVPHIRGEWVLFLGADDYLHDPGVLSAIAPVLDTAYPAHQIVYGKILRISGQGESDSGSDGGPWRGLKKLSNLPPHPSTFHHISLFNGQESFDSTYRLVADSKFTGTALKRQDPLFVDMAITCHTVGGVTSNIEFILTRWFEKNRLVHELGLSVPRIEKLTSFLKAFSKWCLVKTLGVDRYKSIGRAVKGR